MSYARILLSAAFFRCNLFYRIDAAAPLANIICYEIIRDTAT